MKDKDYNTPIEALAAARPRDWRAFMIACTEHELHGMTKRPGMYAGPNPEVLEMLFMRALENLYCLRLITAKAPGALWFIVKAAKKHKIRCGNTTVFCSKRDITLEEMALILRDAWKLCDEAWPMEEDNAMGA